MACSWRTWCALQAIPLTYTVVSAVAAAILGRLTSLTAVVIGGLVIGVLESGSTPIPQSRDSALPRRSSSAGLALLWYQRGGLTLSRMDQFRACRGPSNSQALHGTKSVSH